MIHCIVGHGASGKTTIQNYLKETIPSIVTYTTRPMRHNEIEGVHYHFLNNEEFIKLLNNNFFIEHYYIEKNEWYYGMSLFNIDYKNKDYTVVLDPSGYKKLVKKIGKDNVKCYFINLPERERTVRMYERKDEEKEIIRRIVSDRKDFRNFSNYADIILQSTDSKINVQKILNYIEGRKA